MRWKTRCFLTLRLVCAGVCVIMLFLFGVRTVRDVGRIRRGEVTPAQAIEQTVDWLRGKETGSPE